MYCMYVRANDPPPQYVPPLSQWLPFDATFYWQTPFTLVHFIALPWQPRNHFVKLTRNGRFCSTSICLWMWKNLSGCKKYVLTSTYFFNIIIAFVIYVICKFYTLSMRMFEFLQFFLNWGWDRFASAGIVKMPQHAYV